MPATIFNSNLILRCICSIGAPASQPVPPVNHRLITSNGQEQKHGMRGTSL